MNTKYLIKIYLSKNKCSIIFKVEEIDKISHYFYEKFDPRDFSKKYKDIISQENIKEAFNDIKKIINENNIKIEEGNKKLCLIFLQKNDNDNAKIIFILRKKYICQNKINQEYIEKISNNSKKIQNIEIQMNNLDRTFEEHNNIINNIKNKIDNINNKIQNIFNDINNINNALKCPSKIQKDDNNKSINILNKKKKINKAPKKCSIDFLLLILNIFSFILIYNLFHYYVSLKKEIDYFFEQTEKFNVNNPILDNKFVEKEPKFESETKIKYLNKTQKFENNFIEKNNIFDKTEQNYFKSAEILDIFKNLNLRIIPINQKINLIKNDNQNNEESLKYFQNQISEIKNNTISDFNLILKYSKENSKNDFYINLQTSKEKLLCIQDNKGIIIYIFCSNIIKLIEDIKKNKLEKEKNAPVIFIFKEEETCKQNISNEDILKSTIDIIFDLINNNSYTYDTFDLKIYEVNYTTLS